MAINPEATWKVSPPQTPSFFNIVCNLSLLRVCAPVVARGVSTPRPAGLDALLVRLPRAPQKQQVIPEGLLTFVWVQQHSIKLVKYAQGYLSQPERLWT